MTNAQKKSFLVLKWFTVVLAFLGTADAIYLLILKYTQSRAMCVGSHGCITVNTSVYSQIYGIPVSVFGILAYLVIAGIGLLESRWKLARENGPLSILGISLAGVAFSAYLTYLEFYVIRAVCPFCMASAIIITTILVVAIIRFIQQSLS